MTFCKTKFSWKIPSMIIFCLISIINSTPSRALFTVVAYYPGNQKFSQCFASNPLEKSCIAPPCPRSYHSLGLQRRLPPRPPPARYSLLHRSSEKSSHLPTFPSRHWLSMETWKHLRKSKLKTWKIIIFHVLYLWRSLRSRIQVCPKALAKFWRSDG